MQRSRSSGSMGMSDSRSRAPAQPDWVQFDKSVLRFSMFFKEAVHETASENFRVRKCVLSYFLEDSSLKINEPKLANSGIPQGIFLKRTRIHKPDGTPYTPFDFQIGSEIVIFDRTYKVLDGDARTRQYFEEKLGTPLGPAAEPPRDPHEQARLLVEHETHDPKRSSRQPSIAGKRRADTLGQFLRNDRQVLRFDCVWDDAAPFGERRRYVLHYFLSDDTLEIRECISANDGRDPYPSLLKRQKLPRNSLRVPTADDSPREGLYVSYQDLLCGQCVTVYNRALLLVNCDNFTKDFYRRVAGITQEFVAMDVPEVVRPKPVIPPYNGFGSEDDSLGSCVSLVPKGPRGDWHRFMHNDRKVLRYQAVLKDADVHDRHREFIIAYYLKDDNLAVFEPPRKNSGFIGGKFLEKARYKKPRDANGNPARWYKAADFYVGAAVRFQISGSNALTHTFVITSADNYTRNLMEEDKKEFPEAGSDVAMTRLARKIAMQRIPARQRFKTFDPDGNGSVSKDIFYRLIDIWEQTKDVGGYKLEHGLTGDELESVAQHYTVKELSGNDSLAELGTFAYDEFCDVLSLMQEPTMDVPPNFEQRILQKMQYATMNASGYPISLRQMFKKRDVSGEGMLGLEDQIAPVMRAHQLITDRDYEDLRHFYMRGDGMVRYDQLCDVIYPGNFDSPSVAMANRPRQVRVDGEQLARDLEDLDTVMKTFSSNFSIRRGTLRKAFLGYDTSNEGYVDTENFLVAIRAANPDYPQSQIDTLLRLFFPDDNSLVKYADFMDAMFTRNKSKAMEIRKKREVKKTVNPDATAGQALLEYRAPDKSKFRFSSEQLTRIMREKIQGRLNSGPFELRRAFKHFDRDGSGKVDAYEFQKALLDFNLEISAQDSEEFLLQFDPDGSGAVDYYEFITHVLEHDYGEREIVGKQLSAVS